MNVENFRRMYIAELQELRSVEAQLTEALPQLAGKAHYRELKQVIEGHLRETTAQRDRLDQILRRHNAEPRAHVDQAMHAILEEADKWSNMVRDEDLRDAGLIASLQRVEHYEIAVYGTLAAWANQMGLQDDLRALHLMTEEEKRMDETLTALATREVNRHAAAA